MEIKVVKDSMSREELANLASAEFGDVAKAAVDVVRGIMAYGGELHAGEEVALTEHHGSKREDVWGINLFPKETGKEWAMFDSMINIKPQHGNRSRSVENAETREKIMKIVNRLVSH